MNKAKRFGKYVARSFVRPFTYPYQHISGIGQRLSGQFKKTADAKSKEEAKLQNINYVEATDGSRAFNILFEKNNWTESELAQQLKGVKRAKWIALAIVWGFLSALLAIALVLPIGFGFFLACAFCWLSILCFSVQTIKMALFQAQLENRHLYSLKEFVSRPDFFKRLIF